MASNKKGFVLYADQKTSFESLTDKEAGMLIKHVFKYVNDENPELTDRVVRIAFEPIKMQLKRDLKKYEAIKVKRSEAGKLSAESKKQQNSTKSTSVESVEQTSTKSTVRDTVTDTVKVTDIYFFKIRGEIIECKFSDYFKVNFQSFYEQWLMKNKPDLSKEVFEVLDLKIGYEYADPNHMQNSFRVEWGKIRDSKPATEVKSGITLSKK